MLRLTPLLQKYARKPATIQGGADELQIERLAQPTAAPVAALRPVLDKEAFRGDLKGLMRTNTIAITLVAVVIVVAFVATLLMIRQYATNASAVATLFVGFGALTTALTSAILAMFKVKAQSDLLRILSGNLDAASFQTVIDVLSKRT
jgi:hypothetical protein